MSAPVTQPPSMGPDSVPNSIVENGNSRDSFAASDTSIRGPSPPHRPPSPPAPSVSTASSSSSASSQPSQAAPPATLFSQLSPSLTELCQLLSLDHGTLEFARKVLRKVVDERNVCQEQQHAVNINNERAWLACSVFVANQHAPNQKGVVPLNSILQCTGVKVADLCGHMRHFVSHIPDDVRPGFDADVLKYTDSLLMLNQIFNRFDKLFRKFVRSLSASDDGAVTAEGEDSDSRLLLGFGWLLFLAAKSELCPSADLHSMYILLLAVVKFLMECHPTSPTPNPLEQLCSQADGTVDQQLLQSVRQLEIGKFSAFLNELVSRNILMNTPATVPRGSVSPPASSGRFRWVLHLSNLPDNASRLGHHVDALCTVAEDETAPLIQRGFWLDERVLLQDRVAEPVAAPPSAQRPAPPSAGQSRYGPSSRRLFPDGGAAFTAFSPVTRTPPHAAAATTPITRMMEAVSWLTNSINAEAGSPPEHAVAKLLTGSSRPVSASASAEGGAPAQLTPGDAAWRTISTVVESCSQKISFPGPDGSVDTETTNHRRALAVRLFYRVLLEMIAAERKRIGPQADLAAWLSKESFHRSLLAVCFEIVVFSYKVSSLAFPRVLDHFGIAAFDIMKVSESVVRHCPSLPRSVKSHLRDVEYQVLDSLAWRRGEPLVGLLDSEDIRAYLSARFSATTQPHAPSTPLRSEAEASSSSSASPALHPRLASPAPASTPLPAPATPSRAEADSSAVPKASGVKLAVEIFYRKLFGLAGERIEYLCADSQLTITPAVTEVVWVVVRYVLLERHQLLVGRHLDTVLLCSIYAVCNKLLKQDVKFRKIIAQYVARWEKNSTPVVRAIFHDVGKSLDIIGFYNTVYIPQIKTFLMDKVRPQLPSSLSGSHLAPPPGPALSASPMPRRPAGSPRKVMRGSNVYIAASPLRLAGQLSSPSRPPTAPPSFATPSSHLLTPLTRQLYAFGESPARQLHDINSRVNSAQKVAANAEAQESPSQDAAPRFKRKLYNPADPTPAAPSPAAGKRLKLVAPRSAAAQSAALQTRLPQFSVTVSTGASAMAVDEAKGSRT